MRRIQFALAVAAFGFINSPVKAAPKETMCNIINRVEGGFTYKPAFGLSVLREVQHDGPFVLPNEPNTVTIACIRSSLIPVVEDVKVLQAGYSLFIGGGRGGGISMLELEMKNGTVVANTEKVELSRSERSDLQQILGKMQAVLDAAKPSQP